MAITESLPQFINHEKHLPTLIRELTCVYMKMKLSQYIRVCGLLFTFIVCSFRAEGLDPASYVSEKSLVYVETAPLYRIVEQTKEFFFALADEEVAQADWEMFRETITQELSFDPTDMKEWESAGFDPTSPFAFTSQIFPGSEENPAQGAAAFIVPASNSKRLYNFFYEIYLPEEDESSQENEYAPKTTINELEKGTFFEVVTKTQNYSSSTYVFRTNDFVVISEDNDYIKSFRNKPARPLSRNKEFISQTKLYKSGRFKKNDRFLYVFMNSLKDLDDPATLFPFYSEEYASEMIDHTTSSSLLVSLSANGFNITSYNSIDKEFLADQSSHFFALLDFQPESSLSDLASGSPILYAKIRANFRKLIQTFGTDLEPFSEEVDSIFTKIAEELEMESRLHLLELIDDHLSINIQSLPELTKIDDPVFWNAVVTMNLREDKRKDFYAFMNEMTEKSKGHEQLDTRYTKENKREIWEIALTHIIEPADPEETPIKVIRTFYIIKKKSMIYLTSRQKFGDAQMKLSSKPLIKRLHRGNTGEKVNAYFFLNIKRIIAYYKENKMIHELLSYIKNAKTLEMIIYKDKDNIVQEINLSIDKTP